LPAAYAVIRKNSLLVKRQQNMEHAARARAKDLATKVTLYYVQNSGTYPPNIEALTKKQPSGLNALATKESILDPWGREYRFTVDRDPKDGTERVVVFTGGPPSEKGKKITNIDRVAPPKPKK